MLRVQKKNAVRSDRSVGLQVRRRAGGWEFPTPGLRAVEDFCDPVRMND